MATGYDDSIWGRGADEESPLTGLGTTFASAPDDQTDALMKKLEEVSGRKRPRLSETLSTGDKIAAIFGQIGTTMQRMAGQNVPYFVDQLRARKREEYETGQQDELKTLGLKIQMANMKRQQTQAMEKEKGDFIDKLPDALIKLRKVKGEIATKGLEALSARGAQLFGQDFFGPKARAEFLKGNDTILNAMTELANGHVTPAKIKEILAVHEEDTKLSMEMLEREKRLTVAKAKNDFHAKHPELERPEALQQFFQIPEWQGYADKDPEYQKQPQLGAEAALKQKQLAAGAVLKKAVNSGHMQMEPYLIAMAEYPLVDPKEGLLPDLLAKYEAAKEKGIKIAGVEVLSAPVGETGKTVGDIQVEQKAKEAAAVELKKWEAIPDALRARRETALERARLQAKNEAEAASPKPPSEQSIAAMRDDFLKGAKEFVSVRDAYNRLRVSQPTPAGDIALIFQYMKMLDPTSTVREGEFATAQNAGSVSDRVRNAYNKALNGTRLTAGQRTDMIDQAESIFFTQKDSHLLWEKEMSRIAIQRKMTPSDVIPDLVGAERKKTSEKKKPRNAREEADAYLKGE